MSDTETDELMRQRVEQTRRFCLDTISSVRRYNKGPALTAAVNRASIARIVLATLAGEHDE